LFGTHRFRRSSLGLSYSGNYIRYDIPGYSGSNQSLQFSYDHQLSKRFLMSYRLSAGTSNLPFGGGLPVGAVPISTTLDPNLTAVPTQELFNIRSTYVQGGFGVTYQYSNRLSFNMFASGYGVRRDAKALGGLNGYLGSADVAYRVSKRSTVSLL